MTTAYLIRDTIRCGTDSISDRDHELNPITPKSPIGIV